MAYAMSYPKCLRTVLSLLFLAAAFSASAQLTISGVADKQHYNDAVSFTIVTQTGFAYAATLNGRPVSAGVANTVNRPDYYELAVTRTDNSNGAVVSQWVRFLVIASERGDTEWGLPPHTPAPLVHGAAEEFEQAHLDLIAPAAFPSGYPIPVVAWLRGNAGESVRANGMRCAPRNVGRSPDEDAALSCFSSSLHHLGRAVRSRPVSDTDRTERPKRHLQRQLVLEYQ